MPGKAPARPATRRVPFVVREVEASEVRITGEFTDWDEDGIRLIPAGGGEWRTILPLQPGRYEYRLLVDGAWRDHAEARERVSNPFGSENCVLQVV